MDARRARAHEYLAEELDAYAHWYVAPASSSGGHFLTLTLFAECGNAARRAGTDGGIPSGRGCG